MKWQCEPDEIDRYEISFIRRCLRYLDSPNSDETAKFRSIWAQMTRIRVLLYKHLVHAPDRAGLDAFQEHFVHLDEYQNDQIGAALGLYVMNQDFTLSMSNSGKRQADIPNYGISVVNLWRRKLIQAVRSVGSCTLSGMPRVLERH